MKKFWIWNLLKNRCNLKMIENIKSILEKICISWLWNSRGLTIYLNCTPLDPMWITNRKLTSWCRKVSAMKKFIWLRLPDIFWHQDINFWVMIYVNVSRISARNDFGTFSPWKASRVMQWECVSERTYLQMLKFLWQQRKGK